MTLPSNDRYTLSSPTVLTTEFLLDFPLFDVADLEVWVDGVIETAFSVSATFLNGRSDDAKIILVTAVTGVNVEIYGKRTPRRDNSYADDSPSLAQNLQRDIEAVTAVQQEQDRDFNRSILLPLEAGVTYELSDSAAARANKYLSFDGSGNPISAAGAAGVPVSTYMATLLDDTDAATARATLGALAEMKEDTTPQLGGVLDTNSFQINHSRGADLASTAALPIGTDGNLFYVTGTTAITSMTSVGVGTVITLVFTDALTLTHHSSNLVLLGGADITVAAGDAATFMEYAASQWRMIGFGGISAAADWKAGASAKPSLASPANIKAAIDQNNQIFHIQDSYTSGTAAAALTGATWNTHPLSTSVMNEITGAALATNQVTLPAGTYEIEGYVQAASTYATAGNLFKTRLRNITDSTTEIVGGGGQSSQYSNTLIETHNLQIMGKFTIAAEKVFEVQVWVDGNGATTGSAITSGEAEVYADVIFRKVG